MSKPTRNKRFWLAWLASTLILASALGWAMLYPQADRSLFMPGPLMDGHHQLAESCESCHSDPLGGTEVLDEACESCHGDVRVKPHDSHPKAKFRDPRNADRLASIDALNCVTCHSEHRPEITGPSGVTQPEDFCAHCHQDIAEQRPTHEGMGFETCNSAGCHNYHNNRSLYTDFLIRHLNKPDLRPRAKVLRREFAEVVVEIPEYPQGDYPVAELTKADADAPAEALTPKALADWAGSRHAATGVNCSACHVLPEANGGDDQWHDKTDRRACARCHDAEVKRFGQGKHGMRIAAGLSPMTPELARLPMKESAHGQGLDCQTCHGEHDYNSAHAAGDACLSCHDDEHSLAWKDSPHGRGWQAEIGGEKPGKGAACATCHMPRVRMDVSEWVRRVAVDHNQNANLRPNEKMARDVCLNCHGLQFTLNALADPALIANNFSGQPSVHIDSLDLAKRDRAERRAKRKAARNL